MPLRYLRHYDSKNTYESYLCTLRTVPNMLSMPGAISAVAGKAAGITVAAFLIGSVLGGGLQSWLRVDIVPIGVCPLPVLGS